MTIRDKLESLKKQVSSYAKLGHGSAWDAAQSWKCEAKTTIQSIFGDYVCCKSLEEKIDKLFNALPIASIGGDSMLSRPVNEIDRQFNADIASAVDIINECIETMNRLHENYNLDRECKLDDVDESINENPANDFTSAGNKGVVPTSISRPALSRAASRALDAAMDAENNSFEGTTYW